MSRRVFVIGIDVTPKDKAGNPAGPQETLYLVLVVPPTPPAILFASNSMATAHEKCRSWQKYFDDIAAEKVQEAKDKINEKNGILRNKILDHYGISSDELDKKISQASVIQPEPEPESNPPSPGPFG